MHVKTVRMGGDAVRRTLLIVDDHDAFRSLAHALLDAEGFDVVGEATDGSSALAQARLLRPDVVLLDVSLPDINGFAVCEELCSRSDGPVVVMTSSRDASAYRRQLGSSRAKGFVAKAELSGAALIAVAG